LVAVEFEFEGFFGESTACCWRRICWEEDADRCERVFDLLEGGEDGLAVGGEVARCRWLCID